MTIPPAPNLNQMTIPQLLQALVAGQAGSPMHQRAMFMLQFRIAEKQAEAASQQAEAAMQMTRLTGRLAIATWALVIVSIGLIIATVFPFILRGPR